MRVRLRSKVGLRALRYLWRVRVWASVRLVRRRDLLHEVRDRMAAASMVPPVGWWEPIPPEAMGTDHRLHVSVQGEEAVGCWPEVGWQAAVASGAGVRASRRRRSTMSSSESIRLHIRAACGRHPSSRRAPSRGRPPAQARGAR